MVRVKASDESSEQALESDSGSEDWEDEENGERRASSTKESEYPRLELRESDVRRSSLLTQSLRDEGHAPEAASQTVAAMSRRPRTLPEDDAPTNHFHDVGISRSTRIAMDTYHTHVAVPSSEYVRREMMSTELSGSLRKHLLQERQQNNTMSTAAQTRKHNADSTQGLRAHPNSHTSSGYTEQSSHWDPLSGIDFEEYNARGW